MKFWTKIRNHGWDKGEEYACFEFPDGTSHKDAVKEVDEYLSSSFKSRIGALLYVVPKNKKPTLSYSFNLDPTSAA